MFDLLERMPGTVVLHDFFLGGVLNWMDESWVAPGTFRARLFESHGYSALIADSALGRARTVDRYPCNSRVVEHANGIIVHSDNALHWRDVVRGRRRSMAPDSAAASSRAVRDREAARRALQIDDGDFVVCCFGFIDPAKLDHRLLSAWLRSALAREPRHRLVFVGQNHGGEYGRVAAAIAEDPAGQRVRITGFVDDDTYQRYLCAADAAVQLRGVSRGESARTALDCLAHGLPLIANASDSLSALPDHALIRLRADFDDSELTAAIECLAGEDCAARPAFAGRPRPCSQSSRPGSRRGAVSRRNRAIRHGRPAPPLRRSRAGDRRGNHGSAAAARRLDRHGREHRVRPPATRLPQLLVDVTVLARQDLKTGIERVVRAVLRRLLEHPARLSGRARRRGAMTMSTRAPSRAAGSDSPMPCR